MGGSTRGSIRWVERLRLQGVKLFSKGLRVTEETGAVKPFAPPRHTPHTQGCVFLNPHTQEASVVFCHPRDISLLWARVPTLAPSTHKRKQSECPGRSARGYCERSSHFTSFWFGKGRWKIQPSPHPKQRVFTACQSWQAESFSGGGEACGVRPLEGHAACALGSEAG